MGSFLINSVRGRARICAALVALATMLGAPLLPGADRDATPAALADCLPVPAPEFFGAALDTNFPAGNEFLGRVRFVYFTDDFTGFFTASPSQPTLADDRGVDGLEFEFRDVTATGQFRLLSRQSFNRFMIPDYKVDVVPSEAPAVRPRGSEELLKQSLIEHLARAAGNISEVARAMGRTRMQIHRWMKRFGIDPESFR